MHKEKLKRFFEVHFAVDPEYCGYVSIWTKKSKQKKGGFSLVWRCRADALGTILDGLTFGRTNYYITANRFKNGSRTTGSLFGYSNIVVDIDIHKRKAENIDMDGLLMRLEYFMLDAFSGPDLPMPNTVVHTGRGIQLWWALDPVHSHCNKMYLYVAGRLMDRVEEVIDGTPSLKGMCKVDRAATKRIAGVFRLPGTFNSCAQKNGSFTIYHDKQIDLPDTYGEMWRKDTEERGIPARKWWGWAKGDHRPDEFQPVATDRERYLSELVQLRKKDGAEEEMRDLFLFVLVNSWLTAGVNEDVAVAKADNLNRQFLHPLPEKTYLAYLSTSLRKKGYFLSNAWILSALGITEEEREKIGMHKGGKTLAERKKEAKERREAKRARDEEAVRLTGDKHMDKKGIAAKLGCSPQTAARILKKMHVISPKEANRNKAIAALKRGTSITHVMEKYKLSKSTAYRLLKVIREATAKRKARAEEIIRQKQEKARMEKQEDPVVESPVLLSCSGVEAAAATGDICLALQFPKIPKLLI